MAFRQHGRRILIMHKYNFIEKLTVLQHPESKNIVRLMIEHDGAQNYGLQRSIVSKGNTRHFYNNKIWHSAYHVKLELSRRICDYEEKGFDVMTEISLAPNKSQELSSFDFTAERALSADRVLPITSTDRPIFVAISFDHLDITDLRYNSKIVDKSLLEFFDGLRNTIEFLPFNMVAIQGENQIKVLSLEFKSRPKPKHGINYLVLLSKKRSEFKILDATEFMIHPEAGASYASYMNGHLSFCFPHPWMKANVFIEKHSHLTTCKVYTVREERFHPIYQGEFPNFPRSGNAEVFLSNVEGNVSDIVYVASLGFDAEITPI
jgi:hypothetical protein